MAGSVETMNMQTKPQYLRIVATRASPPTSLQHSSSSWRAIWMLGWPLRCLDTVCCRWPAALIDTKLITTLDLSGMLNGSYPEHTATTLCRPVCAPSKSIWCCDAGWRGDAGLHTQNTHRHRQEARSSSLALSRRTPKQPGFQLAYSSPRPPNPPNPNAVLQLFRKLEHVEAARVEDISGTHRLVSAVFRSSWPERYRRIATSQELQLRSSPIRWTAL